MGLRHPASTVTTRARRTSWGRAPECRRNAQQELGQHAAGATPPRTRHSTAQRICPAGTSSSLPCVAPAAAAECTAANLRAPRCRQPAVEHAQTAGLTRDMAAPGSASRRFPHTSAPRRPCPGRADVTLLGARTTRVHCPGWRARNQRTRARARAAGGGWSAAPRARPATGSAPRTPRPARPRRRAAAAAPGRPAGRSRRPTRATSAPGPPPPRTPARARRSGGRLPAHGARTEGRKQERSRCSCSGGRPREGAGYAPAVMYPHWLKEMEWAAAGRARRSHRVMHFLTVQRLCCGVWALRWQRWRARAWRSVPSERRKGSRRRSPPMARGRRWRARAIVRAPRRARSAPLVTSMPSNALLMKSSAPLTGCAATPTSPRPMPFTKPARHADERTRCMPPCAGELQPETRCPEATRPPLSVGSRSCLAQLRR